MAFRDVVGLTKDSTIERQSVQTNTKDCTSANKVVLKLGSSDLERFTKVFQRNPSKTECTGFELFVFCIIESY